MKLTTAQAVLAYRALVNTKLEIATVRAMRALKDVATKYDDFVKDAVTKLRPDGYDAHARVLENVKGHSDEEVAAARKAEAEYNKLVTECVSVEEKKEHDFDIEPLGEEALERYIKANTLTGAQFMMVEPLFFGK